MLREPVFEPVEQAAEADDPEGLLGAAAAAFLQEGETHTSAMVALFPDAATAAELAIDDGEDAEELHVTLAFLGKAASISREAALNAVRQWAAQCPPLEGEVSGLGYFVGGHDPVTYLSVDLPGLPAQRERLVEMLDAASVPPKRDHGFTPHMTLDYARRRPKIEKPVALRFDGVTLAWGGERIFVPFGGKLEEGLVDFAKTELEKAGLFDEDSDYDGMLGNEILRIVRTFSEGGHSGGSAAMTVAALEKLLRYEPLTPLTSDPEEWMEVVGPGEAGEPTGLWQSRRHPAAFSRDGGATWKIMEAATLLEGKWDPSLHPRWPKGTPRAGEFMKVGQRFVSADGKEWQIAHIAGGKVIANRAEGKYAEAETGVFTPEKVTGANSPLDKGEETHVIADAAKEAKPRKVTGGKGKTSTVPIVDPYVDPSSHDPAIPVPASSKVSAEEWKRFGRIDQEHYGELMERFGKYSPGKAKAMIDEAYKDYEAEIQAIVKNAYSAQYGSSSGFTLSLTSIFQSITGKDKKELEKLDARRQRALELQGRHKDVIAWDLYNRTRSPDVAVFHKSGDPPSYWKEFIDGDRPVMSGLSQSFNFGANFGFGSNTLATPLAIRHILMSSYSAQPIPGQSHFAGELEISVAEQLKIDKRSITFSLHDITANQKKWLMGVTKAPSSGATVERFREALESGEMLPTPPAPPDIQMQGQGQKLWIDPPPEAAEHIASFAKKLPAQQGQPLDPGKLDKSGPWAFKDAGGLPKATVAKESEYKPGDYMMGLKGTLYLIVEDPGDPTGFGLRYVKIENGKFTSESYNFEGGGTNQYFKLSAHFELPDPHKEAQATELFDPHAWVNGEKEAFVAKLKPGDKFKVNGNPYEVKAQLNGAQAQITDLANGKIGTINTDYKTHVLVPKEGYVPEEEPGEAATKLTPAKGMTLAYEGKKHIVTTVLKDGTVKAKPTGGGKTEAIAADDPALDGLYDPTAHKIGAKVKVGDLAEGDLFHGGRGSAQRPYIVIGSEGNKVSWRSLDTGEEGVFTKAKQVRRLEDAEAPDPTAPKNTPKPDAFLSEDDYVEGDETALTSMEPKTKFKVWTGDVYELQYNTPGGESNVLHAVNVKTGESVEFPAEAKGTVLEPKSELSEPIPHEQLKPGDTTTIGNLKTGDFFKVDGEIFTITYEPVTLEDNAGVAPVLPSGAIGPDSSEGSYPDKLVTYTGSAPPLPASDLPEGGYPDLVAEGGFEPYKSKYGSGGKYTHDKLGEMAVGTIFRDKGGKLWKIKEANHIVVVTDGNVLYTADASLRGRVVQEDFIDTTGPVKGPHTDSGEIAAAEGLIPNTAGLSMAELPKGTTVLVGGIVQVVKTPAEAGDEISALAALTELTDGSENLLGPAIIPDQIKVPPKAESVGALGEGDEFKGAGKKTHTVIVKAIDGVVVMNGKGAMAKVSPSTPFDAVDADAEDGLAAKPAVTSVPGNTKISDLEDGAVYSAPGGGLKTVIAKTVNGDVVVMEGTAPGGSMETLPKNAIINSNQVQVPQAGAVQTEWSAAVQAKLDEANLSMNDIPEAPLSSYKSKWGSGGKYQHHRLEELEAGAKFTDKAGAVSTFVGLGPKGKALIFNPGTGALSLVSASARVKLIPA